MTATTKERWQALLLFILLAMCSIGDIQAQCILEIKVKEIFAETYTGIANNDSTITTTLSDLNGENSWTYRALSTNSGGTDTLYSRPFDFARGTGDVELLLRAGNISGTMNTKLQLGLFRGPEIGFMWVDVNTWTSADTASYSLARQSWGPYHLVNAFAIRIIRTGTQKNW